MSFHTSQRRLVRKCQKCCLWPWIIWILGRSWKILEGRFPFSLYVWARLTNVDTGAPTDLLLHFVCRDLYGPNPNSSYVTLWKKSFVDSLNSLHGARWTKCNKQTCLFLRDFEGPPLKAAHLFEHIGMLDFDAVAYAQLPRNEGTPFAGALLPGSNPGTWNNHLMWLFVLT